MTKQPEALRLADELLFAGRFAHESEDVAARRRINRNSEAAIELRRLHTENARLFNAIEDSLKNYARVLRERHEFHEVNQELLEALKELYDVTDTNDYNEAAFFKAEAAIAKAEVKHD